MPTMYPQVDIPVEYFVYLPKHNQIRYSQSLNNGIYNTFHGSPLDYQNSHPQQISIPIPLELAHELGWVYDQDIIDGFDFPPAVRVALRIMGEQV